MSLFVCYPKCTTCKKAEKWLNEQGIPYEILSFRRMYF